MEEAYQIDFGDACAVWFWFLIFDITCCFFVVCALYMPQRLETAMPRPATSGNRIGADPFGHERERASRCTHGTARSGLPGATIRPDTE